MDIEQVRQFVAAARAKTFRDAAEQCHVSQSTLTRSVQRVEADLGAELFGRRGRRTTLNELGLSVLPHASRIVEEADAMSLRAEEARRGIEVLSIASCSPAPLWQLVPALSAQFTRLSVRSKTELSASELEAGVSSGDFDLAILPREPSKAGLVGIRLMRETLSVSLPCGHALANEAALSFSQLDGETFLIQTGTGHWEDVVRGELPHSSFETGSDYILTASLMATSPLPHFATDFSLESVRHSRGHVLIPLTDALATTDYFLAWRRDQTERLSPFVDVSGKLAAGTGASRGSSAESQAGIFK